VEDGETVSQRLLIALRIHFYFARAALLLIGCVLLALAGCRTQRSGTIVVGSKNFTEQIVLAELFAQQIEAHSTLHVERRVNLGGTLLCHQALVAGKIDLYPEYTGTALIAVLNEPPQNDPSAVFHRVQDQYRARFGVEVMPPLGFNNTFAMVVRGDDAAKLRLHTISDIRAFAPKWRAGFGYEFMERPDGYRGWVAAYGLHFASAPHILDLGLLYRALADRQVDLVAGNSTDGLIASLGMVALEDDRHYFPPYEAVPLVRRAMLDKHP
jgi:glycine betaine/choline ABC-type transport system substrate-binding protein